MISEPKEAGWPGPEERFQAGLRLSRPAWLAAVLLIYACFEFPAYLVGNVKYLGMFGLSFALMFLISGLCFESYFAKMAATLLRHRAAIARLLLLTLLLLLASVSQLNQILMAHHMYLQARIVSLPVNRGTLGMYAAFTGVALLLALRPTRTSTPIVLLALAWGIAIRIVALVEVPYTPDAADMLVAVNGACESLLRGANPYSQTFIASATDSFPLIYFPLLWLPYLPFKAVGIDIRWLNLLAQTGLYVFLWSLMRRRGAEGWKPFLLVFLILVPDMVFSVFYRQLSLYWLLGAVFVWLLWQEKWTWSAIAVSALAAMRLPAFTVLWLYLIYVWKRRGRRSAAVHALIAVGMFVALLAPFANAGIARFRYVFFGRFVELAAKGGWQQPLYALSMGGGLERIGLGVARLPMQAVGVFVIGLLYLRSQDVSYGTFVRVAAFTYAYFLWISGFISIYYWFFVLVLLCTLYFIEAGDEKTVRVGELRIPSKQIEDTAQNGVQVGR
jgi:hypothetical protein